MVQSNGKEKNNNGRVANRKTSSSTHKSKGINSRNRKNKSQSLIRIGHAINNSATRHARSTNSSRVSKKVKKNSSSNAAQKRRKTLTGRLNTKKRSIINKNTNNNRIRRQTGHSQQRNKNQSASISSLISTAGPNVLRSDDEFHREMNFGAKE